jgi:hypothetical protein
MRSLFLSASMSLLVSSMTAGNANAHSRCDGGFELIHGRWIATRSCELVEANKVARERNMRVSEHPSNYNEETPEEFCRGNPDIRVTTLCAGYN